MSLLRKFEDLGEDFGLLPMRNEFLWPLEKEFDKFFNEFFNRGLSGTKAGNSYPKLDAYVEGNKWFVKVAVPDVNPENVSVEMRPDHILRISGSSEHKKTEEKSWYVSELRKSSFVRDFKLPSYVQGDPVAEIKNGMLTLSWDLPEDAFQKKEQVRKIEVKKS